MNRTSNVIPPMTHELGKHWDQPDPARILIDDTHAVLSKADWEELCEYSGTIPTAVYEGKMWKRIEDVRYYGRDRNLLCWFGVGADPNRCTLFTREAIIV